VRTSRHSAATTDVFDAWNRGVSIRGSTFTYDALGRRVTESDSTDSQYFYYAGQQMIENAPQSGATVRHQQFVYGIDYIDHVILRDRDADNAGDTGSLGGEGSGLEERLYYTHNRQFSVTGLVSQTGTVVERTIYDPYGESQYFSSSYASPTATSSYANNVSFTGRWVDPTGELYFRARYYDPELGRFISQDPMMYVDGMSMYGYCRSNPLCLLDPMGLCGKPTWWDYFSQAWDSDAYGRVHDQFYTDLTNSSPQAVTDLTHQLNWTPVIFPVASAFFMGANAEAATAATAAASKNIISVTLPYIVTAAESTSAMAAQTYTYGYLTACNLAIAGNGILETSPLWATATGAVLNVIGADDIPIPSLSETTEGFNELGKALPEIIGNIKDLLFDSGE
jgi:RHS repeat-associated protein